MNNELNDIPADIRGKLRFPLDGLSGPQRRDRSEREEHPCLSEASWGCDSERRSQVARQRQP